MKRTYNTWIAAALIGLALSQPVYSCGVSWTVPKDHFDGVNERGYVSIWQQIGTLDLGEELKIPLIIGFESNREWSSPHVGQGFILALLDSRFEQVDENLFRMIQPDGWTSVFRRDHKIKNILGGQGGWKAEITGDNTITAYATCGWKLVYKQGKISSIGTPKGRTLDYVYSGGRVAEIRDKGSVVLSTRVDSMSGVVAGLVIGGKEISLTQAQRPQVQKIKGQNLVAGMSSALNEVKQPSGETNSYAFTVDEKLNPTLTINQKRTITWDAETKRILKDGEWTYNITPSNDPLLFYAAIGRINAKKQSELWHLDAGKGIETTMHPDGMKTVSRKFVSGPLTGKIRSIEAFGANFKEEKKFVYNENAELIKTIKTSSSGWINETTYFKGLGSKSVMEKEVNGKSLSFKTYATEKGAIYAIQR